MKILTNPPGKKKEVERGGVECRNCGFLKRSGPMAKVRSVPDHNCCDVLRKTRLNSNAQPNQTPASKEDPKKKKIPIKEPAMPRIFLGMGESFRPDAKGSGSKQSNRGKKPSLSFRAELRFSRKIPGMPNGGGKEDTKKYIQGQKSSQTLESENADGLGWQRWWSAPGT